MLTYEYRAHTIRVRNAGSAAYLRVQIRQPGKRRWLDLGYERSIGLAVRAGFTAVDEAVLVPRTPSDEAQAILAAAVPVPVREG